MRIGILEPDSFSARARMRLATVGDVSDHVRGDVEEFLADKDALFVRLRHAVDDRFLSHAPRLRTLVSPTTGHTHLDLDALARRGVAVLSLAGERAFLETIRATPEHTLGLILALLRNYRTAFLSGTNRHWDRDSCRGDEIAGLAIGLVGFGRVGRRLAGYLGAMDAELHWTDPAVAGDGLPGRRHDDVASLIAASRLVVLCASCSPGAPPILGADEIAALSGRYFVNTARGELVDEPALLDAIEAGRLAGVAVDVIADEQREPAIDRWIEATRNRNVVVTPHVGGATWRSMHATEEFMADKLVAHLERLP